MCFRRNLESIQASCRLPGWIFHFLMISACEDSQVGGSGAIDHILRQQGCQVSRRGDILALLTRHRPLKHTDVRKGLE